MFREVVRVYNERCICESMLMATAVTISIHDKRDLCAYINSAFYWLSLSERCNKRFYRTTCCKICKKIYK